MAATEPEPADSADWFVYVVRCADATLYTGIARFEVARRIDVHNAGKGAKYTRGRGPVTLQAQAGPMPQGEALRLERRLKKLPRVQKIRALQTWRA